MSGASTIRNNVSKLCSYMDRLHINVPNGYMLISKIELVNEGENTIPNIVTMSKKVRTLSAQFDTAIAKNLEELGFAK